MTTVHSTFDFFGKQLRTVKLEGAPWFVAIDACRCLGLSVSQGVFMHLKKLGPDQKQLVKYGVTPKVILDQILQGKERQATLINESGLFLLIMRANPTHPEVFNFQNWVTKDVLPAIRKTGGYLLNEEARESAHADNREEMPLPKESATFQLVRTIGE